MPLLATGTTVEALRQKLTHHESPLAPWWKHFLTLSRQDPEWFHEYAVLAALVTGEEQDRQNVRRLFLDFVQLKDEGDSSLDAQFHTHVTVAPLGRLAIFYDWVADLGLFTPDEDQSIRQAMLDHAFVFALQHTQSRALAFENQLLSNVFCSAAAGYVLGVKRGSSPLARRMFDEGLRMLRELLGRIPTGGYGCEGSAYQDNVIQPIVALAGMLVQDVTGEPVFESGLPPHRVPLLDVLDVSWRTLGPSGLTPGWDHYGHGANEVKCGMALLARLQRDPRPLAAVRDLNIWYRNAIPAWGHDDRLWTLVWWPDNAGLPEHAAFEPWLNPPVGGALQSAKNRIRLMQYWDECGGVGQSGRRQVDPNAFTFEAFGSPLVLDGKLVLPAALAPMPEAQILAYAGSEVFESAKRYVEATWGGAMSMEAAIRWTMDGNIGQSNALILDHEDWYVPLRPCRGHGEALHTVGPLQVLRSDAADYYRDRYDVERALRTSLMVDDRYALLCDQVTTRTPHAITWQAFLRRETTQADGRVTIRSAEQVQCDLIFGQPGAIQLDPVPQGPDGPEVDSMRCRFMAPAAATVRLDAILIPQRTMEEVADLTDGWQRRIGENRDAVSLKDAFLSDTGEHPEKPRIFVRGFDLPESHRGRILFVELAFGRTNVELRLNGIPVPQRLRPPPEGHWHHAGTLPLLFDITSCVNAGPNELELRSPYYHGESACGPCRLFQARKAVPTTCERTGPESFRITVGDATDNVLLERNTGCGPWAGGETDARYALALHDGRIAVSGATVLRLPGQVALASAAPCDMHWSPAETGVWRADERMPLTIEWERHSLRVELSGCLTIAYHGATSHQLRVALPNRRGVVVNGEWRGMRGGPAEPVVAVALDSTPPASVVTVAPQSASDVYALMETAGPAAAPALLAALAHGAWRVQLAAADVVGHLHVCEAVPALLRLFEEAERELPYPEIKFWWRWSSMSRGPDYKEGAEPEAPPPLAVKRWRVKRAVVSALGRLGDARAIPPLLKAMERDSDFFPVASQLPLALARLGATAAIPLLRTRTDHGEFNARLHIRLALAYLTGAIDRRQFEEQSNG
jgi:hypothetical protein